MVEKERKTRTENLRLAFLERAVSGSGGFGKSSDAQWLSLDRPRSRPALHSFDHPTSHLYLSPYLSPPTIAIAFLCSF